LALFWLDHVSAVDLGHDDFESLTANLKVRTTS
jgi:hypothetical protein